jgi:hypothetical protein
VRRFFLPITVVVLVGMVGIPIISIQLTEVWDDRRVEPDTVRLVDLNDLPREHAGRQATELEALRDWLEEHFDDEEIAEMRDRFIDGRDPDEVRAEVDELAESAARGDYLRIPRYFTDAVKERLGKEMTRALKNHIQRLEPTTPELRGLAIDELYPPGAQ